MRKEKKTKWVHVRLTEKEEKTLDEKFRKSTCSQLSQYARKVLLSQPILIKYRNETLDSFMEEVIGLRQELNAIGNNFNQAVKKLHTLNQIPEFRTWINQYQTLQEQLKSKTDHINERISKMSEKWLQE